MVKTTTCDQVKIGESATEPLSDSGGALGQLMVSLSDRRESIAKRSTTDCQYSDGYDHRGIISATTAANDVSACLSRFLILLCQLWSANSSGSIGGTLNQVPCPFIHVKSSNL